jgi:DNA-binding NtrC family response regulator
LKSLIRNIRSAAEQKAIRTALDRTGWNRKAAAQLLDVSYRTLLYKIEQYRMRAPESNVNGFPFAGPNGNGKDAKRNGKAS